MGYLANLIAKHSAPPLVDTTFRRLRTQIETCLSTNLIVAAPRFYYGGSFAKRTMIDSGYDLDLVVYFPASVSKTIKEIYEGTERQLKSSKYITVRHNVAIRLPYEGFHIDVVPGRAVDSTFKYANLFASDKGTTKQTSLKMHIDLIRHGGDQDVIKVLKLWRRCHGVKISSFLLELATKEALYNNRASGLEDRVWKVLVWLSNKITTARLVDPANSNNVLTNDLASTEKKSFDERRR